jgi:3-hydroxyisobutyrate dehydrogenase
VEPAQSTIGVIGVGRMGPGISRSLVGAGFDVVAGDRDGGREQVVRAAGARWLGETAQVAAAADVLITVLPGTAELLEVMAAVGPALASGATWIDMTSCAPVAVRDLVETMRARGVDCLDAPAGGGPGAARIGALHLFVGGEAETVERHRMLLQALGRVEHVGESGAGYTIKLLVNLLWFGQAVAVAEALLLARRVGLDLKRVRALLAHSPAASRFVEHDLDAVFTGDYLENFGLDRCCEELDAIATLADEQEVPFEIAAAVRRVYREALERYGAVDGELLAVALLEEQAGVLLRGDGDGHGG